MTIPYLSMNVAVVKVKASHKTDCPETPVFVVSSPSAILVWYRRKVHSDVCDGLNSRFLVIGYGCLPSIIILFRGLAKHFNLFVDDQYLCHFLFKLRVPSLQIVGGLVGRLTPIRRAMALLLSPAW